MRKIALLIWLPKNLPHILREIRRAEAVHAPVPGDLGTLGILLALLLRKKLFIRHCGTWGNRTTAADRFLDWLLPRIAGKQAVVFATGGGDTPPSKRNPAVKWIFSTSMTKKEIESIPVSQPWKRGSCLRLVTVGRLSRGKNAESIIRALPIIAAQFPDVTLDILGEGEARPMLEQLATNIEKEISRNTTSSDPLHIPSPDQISKLTSQIHYPRVRFHGNVSHDTVIRILGESHVFVFPTRVKEGFPKAVLEAMACGLPVVATNVSVIPNIIRDCGIVLEDTGPEHVAEGVLRIAESTQKMAHMSETARRVAQRYSLEDWRDDIGKVLESTWGSILFKNSGVMSSGSNTVAP